MPKYKKDADRTEIVTREHGGDYKTKKATQAEHKAFREREGLIKDGRTYKK